MPTVVWVKNSEKKINFVSGLRSRYHSQADRKERILPLRKILQNDEGHDYWHCQYITFLYSTYFFWIGFTCLAFINSFLKD